MARFPRYTNNVDPLDHREADALKSDDAQAVLEEPYALAVQVVGDCQRQEILQAIEALKKRNAPLSGEELWKEIMNRESLVPSRQSHLKRHAKDGYGSDGETSEGCMEYLDVSPSLSAEDDLQQDSEASARPIVDNLKSPEFREPPTKKSSPDSSACGGKEVSHLRRKLHALREENRLLKARKLCRKCGVKGVSITFLPCGHFRYCYQCGQGFQKCPICQKTILADVRTFLA